MGGEEGTKEEVQIGVGEGDGDGGVDGAKVLPLWQRVVMYITPFSYGPKDGDTMDHPRTAIVDLVGIVILLAVSIVYVSYTLEAAENAPPIETRKTYRMDSSLTQVEDLELEDRPFRATDLQVKLWVVLADRGYDGDYTPGTASEVAFTQGYITQGLLESSPHWASYDSACPNIYEQYPALDRAGKSSDTCAQLARLMNLPAIWQEGLNEEGGVCMNLDLCYSPTNDGDGLIYRPVADYCDPELHPGWGAYPTKQAEGLNFYVNGVNETIVTFQLAYFSELESDLVLKQLNRRKIQLLPTEKTYIKVKQTLRVDADNGNKILTRSLQYSSTLTVSFLGDAHSADHGDPFHVEGCADYPLYASSAFNINLDPEFDIVFVSSSVSAFTLVGAISGFIGLASAILGFLRTPFLPA